MLFVSEEPGNEYIYDIDEQTETVVTNDPAANWFVEMYSAITGDDMLFLNGQLPASVFVKWILKSRHIHRIDGKSRVQIGD